MAFFNASAGSDISREEQEVIVGFIRQEGILGFIKK
jgi:hypothetical protein